MAEDRDILTREAPPPTLTVSYGDHPDQAADVWLPSEPGPVVLCWHGGFWRQEFDRGYLAPLAAALAAAGYVVANVEYRRTGGAGGWPATVTDAARAADTLPELVAAAAPGRVAGGAPYHLGHSAGGHLALWTALRHRLPAGAAGRLAAPPAVAGVLALAPVTDVAEAYRRDLDIGAAGALLGGGPAEYPGRYAAASPAALGAPDAPTTLLHGRGDGRVPVVLSREYARRHAVRLLELDGVDHFALIDPATSCFPLLRTELARLPTA